VKHARRTRAFCLAILLWCHSPAFALNPSLHISQYGHTAWTIREGFLGGPVSSIAQTPDGYLWLGTESGLLRFDGVRAVRWQPRADEQLPSTNILKLLVTRDGRLWIGTFAGLASWKDGRLVTYPELAGEMVVSLAEDSQRTVWAGTIGIPYGRLCTIGHAVQCVGQDGRLGVGVFSLFEDAGALWAGAASGLWRWAAGDPTRYATTPNISDVGTGANGRLLIATADGVRQLVGDRLADYPIRGVDPPRRALRLLLDRDRGVWIGTQAGLVHVHDGQADLFVRSDGLSGDTVLALFEDREGNVWVATNEGLDRFRELPVTILSRGQGMPMELTAAVLAARDGSVWIGAPDGLTRWKNGRTRTYRTRQGLPDDRVGTLFEDSAGRILVATLGGMAVFEQDRFAPLRSVSTRIVYGIVQERPGEFWITDQEGGLIHLVGNEIVTRTSWSAFGRDDHATALLFDGTRAGLWLGFYKGGVAFVQNGIILESYGTGDGLGAGRVSQLQFDPEGGVWAATAGGLSRIKEKRVATLTTQSGLPCASVHWTIADTDRALWLSMSCGLARISSADIAAWSTDSNRSVQVTLFDSSDGVRSVVTPIGFSPPAARLPDGRLWFATPNGVGVVDPRHLPFNSLPAVVHIEQIAADRKTYDTATETGDRVRLPPRIRDLQIDYTAVSLVAPEKVRFRYKLDGYDRDWQDAGNRRQAFYTNLPPRNYRFRVTASNNSGVWNEADATFDFAIAPAYYQTTWFLALSMISVVSIVWAAHRIRLRMAEKHQSEISALNERLMKAQEQERIRIAGELHDGVMQEMLAATMMLGTAKRRIPADSAATAPLTKCSRS
jgi:ligand-binding sensor domain-containing protein